jgi:tRNA(Ile)-lysidine synthetase-like protein
MLSLSLQPGKYVLAISGGVDSMVLMHLANLYAQSQAKENSLPGKKSQKYSFVVAHFDHGIRADSHIDRKLVAQQAKHYRLPFVYENGNLGAGASENKAREARYDFLKKVQSASKSHAIVTAHHQDDMVETAVFNILRGTGRLGVSSLKDHPHLRRPLLAVTKKDIRTYAKEQGLVWREDSTNQNTAISRNYIRRVLLPKLTKKDLEVLINTIRHLKVVNNAIDKDIMLYLHVQPSRQSLDRHSFTLLPHSVATEVIAGWLRSHSINTFDKKMLERIVASSKTLMAGKKIDIDALTKIHIGKEVLVLVKTGK